MGAYAGDNNYPENIYLFEETDVVQGGPDGIDNVPLKDLADRTTWLKENVGLSNRIVDEVISTGGDIDESFSGKLVVAKSNGSINLSLENANTFLKGTIIPIASYCTAGSVVNLLSPDSPIYDSYDDSVISAMYMHNKEKILLVAMDNHFRVLDATGNFYCAGEEVKVRKAFGNMLPLQGQLLSRARYPRLWAYVQTLTFGQEVVSESTWFSSGLIYQGLFTTGDGATTFRIPDERGLFERMMDGGRGIDLSRLHGYPGGYEADDNKAHSHKIFVDNGNTFNRISLTTNNSPERRQGLGTDAGNNNYEYSITGSNGTPTLGNSSTSGSSEVTVKNIGKLNMIKF